MDNRSLSQKDTQEDQDKLQEREIDSRQLQEDKETVEE